jgi:gamma-glutamyl:cysteine ligase YbdK (ATP-grasp superfamily)
MNGLLAHSAAAARAVGELARSGAASRRAVVEPADGLRRLPRAPARRRASATTTTTPRSSGSSSAPGCIADYTHIWWDIRRHPRLGTIEIRVCDAVTRLEDAVAIAAYCQALVKQLLRALRRGRGDPGYHRILTTENKWLAARYGSRRRSWTSPRAARTACRSPARPAHAAEIEPHARELGSERELEGIARLLARGNSADRQLRIFNANRDITEVVEEIAIATELLPVEA